MHCVSCKTNISLLKSLRTKVDEERCMDKWLIRHERVSLRWTLTINWHFWHLFVRAATNLPLLFSFSSILLRLYSVNDELRIRVLNKNNADDLVFNLLKIFIKEQQN